MNKYERDVVIETVTKIEEMLQDSEVDWEMRYDPKDMTYHLTIKEKAANDISEEEWQKAIQYLETMIVEYASIGMSGRFGLDAVLVPLRKRYEAGERTRKLYDEIMTVE